MSSPVLLPLLFFFHCACSYTLSHAFQESEAVLRTEYACQCGTTLRNVTDVSIPLHLSGTAHRNMVVSLSQADNAYTVRTSPHDRLGTPLPEVSCIDGNIQVDATESFWLGTVRESGHLGHIPNSSEVLDPPPPPHMPPGEAPPLPLGALPPPTPSNRPPLLLRTPKSSSTQLGVHI